MIQFWLVASAIAVLASSFRGVFGGIGHTPGCGGKGAGGFRFGSFGTLRLGDGEGAGLGLGGSGGVVDGG